MIDQDDSLVKLITKLDDLVGDAETREEDLQFLADIRSEVVARLRDQVGEYRMRDLPVCRCECHQDMSIEYHGQVCDYCKCFNEFRDSERP